MDRKIRAFTLLEVTIVLVILAILGFLGVSYFQTWKTKHEATKDISLIFSNLRLLRMKALTYNKDYDIKLSPDGKKLAVYSNGKITNTIELHTPFRFSGSTSEISISSGGSINRFTLVSSLAYDGKLKFYPSCIVSNGLVLFTGRWNGKKCEKQ